MLYKGFVKCENENFNFSLSAFPDFAFCIRRWVHQYHPQSYHHREEAGKENCSDFSNETSHDIIWLTFYLFLTFPTKYKKLRFVKTEKWIFFSPVRQLHLQGNQRLRRVWRSRHLVRDRRAHLPAGLRRIQLQLRPGKNNLLLFRRHSADLLIPPLAQTKNEDLEINSKWFCIQSSFDMIIKCII